MNPNDTKPVSDTVINNPSVVVPSGSEKKVGPIVATLIIVLVLIIAALYVFASKINQPAIPTDNTAADMAPMSDQTGTVMPVKSTSTDEADMQADLDASTKGLDQQNF